MTQPQADRLRLLTYNIQAGNAVERYRHYVTRGLQHLLPHPEKAENLETIARLLAGFDLVGLQEVDDGSLRTGFVNQTQFLAERAGFPFWSHQANRDLAKIARSCNSLLSRLRPTVVHDYKLPGRIPGRGALVAQYGEGDDALTLVIVHLSLGRQSRLQQLSFLREIIQSHRHIVLMGDLNTSGESLELKEFLAATDLQQCYDSLPTYPSWRPHRALDHVLLGAGLTMRSVEALDVPHSDHLPLAMEIQLPAACAAQVAGSRN